MNFLNLKYFVVTVEEMNFTKAAKRLYISQQSLSNHIAKLEKHFGVQLFDRNAPLTLTDAGYSLYQNAKKILNDKKETELELQDIRDFRSAVLTIGVPNARGAAILPPLLSRFHREYPHVQIKLIEGTSYEIGEALNEGRVDFTIGFEINAPDRICSEVLQEEQTLIVIRKNLLEEYFTKTEQKELLKKSSHVLSTFRCCPFVKMKHSNWLGRIFEDSCREEGLIPNVVLETSNIATMVALCEIGYAAIICPSIFIGKNKTVSCGGRNDLYTFILDYPEAHKKIAANYLKNKYQTKAAQEFIRISKEEIAKL